MTDSGDLLIRFVTLSGDDDHIARRSGRNCVPDRNAAIQLHLNRNATLEARRYFSGDRSGIFRTRVVAGNPHAVGTRFGGTRHQRALAAIAIAAASEYADDPTRDVTLHTRQNLRERIGRMREVYDHQRLPGRANELHAPRWSR